MIEFGNRWKSWTKLWLELRKINVDINEEVGRKITYTRGLKEGDPLSPLIFTLVAEGLNMII